ncbi:nucleoside hydrolase [Actinotignum schaalii]|uniref:nucleoside hydrolase n=1 Tax=Actinotignum schaalii TaxID=59505 RepID=UPI0003F718C5|nr:nucleoside hydrolase [Actinotignum schaalii]AIE82985.1 hypothetical protein FB03_06670 [Actinotignum schaalii]WQN45129.1 nucleoside hydrolase [Actinotignum schaalii]
MIRLIHDTDTAQDDAFALMIGLRHPETRVEAVTINYGNIEFDQMVKNALYTIEVADLDYKVPVYKGCRLPLIVPHDDSSYVHGKDGFGDVGFPDPQQQPESEHAVDALIRIINENPGEISIVAQAPLTNIATAVSMDRSLPEKVKHLYIMGGQSPYGPGNVTAAAEANFWHDPEAAKLVLQAGFKITILTWDLTMRQGRLSRKQLKEIEDLKTPQSEFFTKANAVSVKYVEKTHGVEGSTHPDSLAAAVAVNPDIITRAEEYFVDVEADSELTRGYMFVDVVNRSGKKPNARVVHEIDQEAFFQTILNSLR